MMTWAAVSVINQIILKGQGLSINMQNHTEMSYEAVVSKLWEEELARKGE